MASPQIEDSYIQIAMELFEAICKIRIPGEARQVFDCIIRKTYGWKKTCDSISLSQFVEASGINKQNVVRSIQKLEQMNLIVIQKDTPPVPKKITQTTRYRINKDYESWKPLSKKITLSKKIISSVPKKIHTKDTITKEKRIPPNLTKNQIETFEKFWAIWPKKVARSDAEKAWMKIAPTNGLAQIIYHAVEIWKQTPSWNDNNGQFIPYPATWLNGKRWKDEIKTTTQQPPDYKSPIITAGDNSIFENPEINNEP